MVENPWQPQSQTGELLCTLLGLILIPWAAHFGGLVSHSSSCLGQAKSFTPWSPVYYSFRLGFLYYSLSRSFGDLMQKPWHEHLSQFNICLLPLASSFPSTLFHFPAFLVPNKTLALLHTCPHIPKHCLCFLDPPAPPLAVSCLLFWPSQGSASFTSFPASPAPKVGINCPVA